MGKESVVFTQNGSQEERLNTVISALGRLGKNNCESQVILGYMVRPCIRTSHWNKYKLKNKQNMIQPYKEWILIIDSNLDETEGHCVN